MSKSNDHIYVVLLAWPKSSFEFFHYIKQQSLKTLFGQPNISGLVILLCWSMGLSFCHTKVLVIDTDTYLIPKK